MCVSFCSVLFWLHCVGAESEEKGGKEGLGS